MLVTSIFSFSHNVFCSFIELNASLTLYQIDKILDQIRFRALADDKINEARKLEFALGKVGNIFGEGENAGYQHFLLFQKCFLKSAFSGVIKSWHCAIKSYPT